MYCSALFRGSCRLLNKSVAKFSSEAKAMAPYLWHCASENNGKRLNRLRNNEQCHMNTSYLDTYLLAMSIIKIFASVYWVRNASFAKKRTVDAQKLNIRQKKLRNVFCEMNLPVRVVLLMQRRTDITLDIKNRHVILRKTFFYVREFSLFFS